MLLKIHNLAKLYDLKKGLTPTSFEVSKGELIAIVGHNGAGKSTLLKMLASWIIPDSGSVMLDGINMRNRAAVVGKVGAIPEVPNLFDFFLLNTISNFSRRSPAPPPPEWKRFWASSIYCRFEKAGCRRYQKD